MRSVIAWAGIGALWWLAGAILWLHHKHRRKQHSATHHALRLSGRAHLDSEIDPQTYADAMLRVALAIFAYVLAFVLFLVGMWFASTLVVTQ